MKVLAVGAHFDDIELGCSGTLMKHIYNGDKVTMIVVTDSEYTNPVGEQIRSRKVAEKEGQKAAEIIGAELICLEYKTFNVPFNEDLTSKISQYIDELSVDTIYAPWTGDLHRDHHYTGKCTLMAGRHIKKFLMYRSNYYETEFQFKECIYSDISEFMEEKIKVIKAHKSELERVRYSWLDFFVNQNKNYGQRIGVEYAECFEPVRYLI